MVSHICLMQLALTSSIDSVSDESMNDGTFKDDYFEVPLKGKRKATDIEFSSLSQAEVEELIRKDVDQISVIFGIDVSSESAVSSYCITNMLF